MNSLELLLRLGQVSRPRPVNARRNSPRGMCLVLRTKDLTTKGPCISVRTYCSEGWFGDYDYCWLCIPSLPFHRGKKKSSSPPFYALDDELPLLLAVTNGLQHSLAMLAGLITPPIIFASALNLDAALSSYMISASLIGSGEYTDYRGHTSKNINIDNNGSGILSLVQMSRITLFRQYKLGTGLISVVGTSFATLSTANGVRIRDFQENSHN